MNPCHILEPGPCTTDAYYHACGTCGGDRRRPVSPGAQQLRELERSHIAGASVARYANLRERSR